MRDTGLCTLQTSLYYSSFCLILIWGWLSQFISFSTSTGSSWLVWDSSPSSSSSSSSCVAYPGKTAMGFIPIRCCQLSCSGHTVVSQSHSYTSYVDNAHSYSDGGMPCPNCISTNLSPKYALSVINIWTTSLPAALTSAIFKEMQRAAFTLAWIYDFMVRGNVGTDARKEFVF